MPIQSDRQPDDTQQRATLRWVAILAGVVLLIWLLSDIVLLIFMAVLLAVMLRGAADGAARYTGVPRDAMLAFVTVGLTVILLAFLYYIGPRLIDQSQALYQRVTQTADSLRATYGNTKWGQSIFHLFSTQQSMQSMQSNIPTDLRTVATSTLDIIVKALILIVTALYFAISPDLYINGVVRLFPQPYRPRARMVLVRIGETLRWWSLGQLIDMVLVAVLTGIGLTILGIPLALALAVIAGVFTFVPYFGAIAAAVPAALVAFTVSWQSSLWVVVIFLLCHGIEGYLVSPLVQRNTVRLPPAVTILSMTIFGALFGSFGVILGAPIAAVLLVLTREVYVGDVLGDPE